MNKTGGENHHASSIMALGAKQGFLLISRRLNPEHRRPVDMTVTGNREKIGAAEAFVIAFNRTKRS
jgi:hypothetical protein